MNEVMYMNWYVFYLTASAGMLFNYLKPRPVPLFDRCVIVVKVLFGSGALAYFFPDDVEVIKTTVALVGFFAVDLLGEWARYNAHKRRIANVPQAVTALALLEEEGVI